MLDTPRRHLRREAYQRRFFDFALARFQDGRETQTKEHSYPLRAEPRGWWSAFLPKAPGSHMRYPPLLVTLFLAFLLRPFLSPSAPFSIFVALVFLSVIYAFRHVRSLAISLAVLGGSAVTFRLMGNYGQSSSFLIMSHVLSFIAMVLVMIAMLSEVLRARTASTDLVIGAVCLYLVIGLAWTFLYYSIYLLSPDSIFAHAGPVTPSAASGDVRFTEVFYFSLSALTTIGSSGEEPLTTMARQLAVVESAMGQLYLAVLISRLVGFSTTGDTKATS